MSIMTKKIKSIIEALVAKEAVLPQSEYTAVFKVPMRVTLTFKASANDDIEELARDYMSMLSNPSVQSSSTAYTADLDWEDDYGEDTLVDIERGQTLDDDFGSDDDVEWIEEEGIIESAKISPLVKTSRSKDKKVQQELPKRTPKAAKVQTTLEADELILDEPMVEDPVDTVEVLVDLRRKRTRSGQKEIATFIRDGQTLGQGTYSWQNRPWQSGEYSSATARAVEDMRSQIPEDVYLNIKDIMEVHEGSSSMPYKIAEYLTRALR